MIEFNKGDVIVVPNWPGKPEFIVGEFDEQVLNRYLCETSQTYVRRPEDFIITEEGHILAKEYIFKKKK